MFKLFGSSTETFKPIFDKFYASIMSNPLLDGFFRDKYQIKLVIEKQIKHFAGIHKLKNKQLRTLHRKLGKDHAKRGISFSSMETASDFLYKRFLFLFRKNPNSIIALDNFFTLIGSNIAYGYLEHEVEEFTEQLRIMNGLSTETDTLKDHLEWFLMLHSMIMNNSREDLSHYLEIKPELKEIDIKSDSLRYEIIKVSDNFSLLHENMLFSFEQQDFRGALAIYTGMKESFLSLTYLLSLAEQSNMVASFLTDPLTGALTRKQLDSIMDKAAAQSMMSGKPYSVVMADIDYFKSVNDTYGHKAGDMVLKSFSELLESNKQCEEARLIRYGGEEFTLIFPQKTGEETAKIVEGIRLIIEMTPFNIGKRTIHITSSFGVHEEPPADGNIPEPLDIIKQADENLYKAKNEGRNRVIF